MKISLEKRRAMVCGSTQGIGRATAIELAALGAAVTLVARNEDRLREMAANLPTVGGQVHDYICADFSKPPQLAAKVSAHLSSGTSYHILVNNTAGPAGGSALDAAVEAYEQAFRQHLICNQILVQALAPGMRREAYGRIINIISTSVKQPITGLGVSNTIRAAVANWSKTLSVELAEYGITVNNVLPGATNTGRLKEIISGRAQKSGLEYAVVERNWINSIPAKRFAGPEEIAAAVAFLASPAAAYITGINLPVDGGRTMSL